MEEKQPTCESWLANELDPRIAPTSGPASYRVFALKDTAMHQEPHDVERLLRSGHACQGMSDSKGVQILLNSTSGKQSEYLQVRH